MALLKDTDYFLVSDDNASFSIKKSDLKNEIGGSQVIVGENPPDFKTDDLEEGTLWWDNSGDDARLYILYNDKADDTDGIEGTLKWVDASPPGGGGVPITEDDVEIKKPKVLTPPDGAGIGVANYTPKTSAITDVDETINTFDQPSHQKYINLFYGNGKYVASSSNKVSQLFMSSPDGINWTTHDAGDSSSQGIEGIAFGNNLFVACGAVGNQIYTSPDGETWTQPTTNGLNANHKFNAICWTGQHFVITSSSNPFMDSRYFAYSTNGVDWTYSSAPSSSDRFTYMASDGNGNVVAMNYNTSNDAPVYSNNHGQTWKRGSGLGKIPTDNVIWDGSRFVVSERDSTRIFTSSDGDVWKSTGGLPNAMTYPALAYGGDKYIITTFDKSSSWLYSYDLSTWTAVTNDEHIRPSDVIFGDKWVAISSDTKKIQISHDGINWNNGTQLTLTDANTYNNADGADMGQPISETFTAGQTVKGENATGTYGTETAAFSTTLYTGNAATQTITTNIDNTDKFLIWTKNRDGTNNHNLMDNFGIVVPRISLSTNTTKPGTSTGSGFITDVSDTGFTLTNNYNSTNTNGQNIVAWNFRGAPGFFDVVTYQGNDLDNRQVPHSLGSTPGMIMVKSVDHSRAWRVWHKELPNGKLLELNAKDGAFDDSNISGADSSTFTVNNLSNANYSDSDYVAYLFADTPGLIKCGSYTGTDSGNVVVNCGFKPGWVLIKHYNNTEDWVIIDNKRANKYLEPNTNLADKTQSNDLIFTDTGFEQPWGENRVNGGSSYEYIYVAIAEDVTAGEFQPSGTLTEDADKDGPTITLTDVKGTWENGMEVVSDTEVTKEAPGADSIVFTSDKPVATSGSVKTWEAEWQLSVDSGFADKQEAKVTLNEVDVEQGPTFTLADDTKYWVRTRYTGEGGDVSEWSEVNNFKTAGGSSGADGNFSTTIYSGDGSALINPDDYSDIVSGVDNTNKSLVWIKDRTSAYDNCLYDTERGVNQKLISNKTDVEVDESGTESLASFNNNGFSLGAAGRVNATGDDYVAWNFAAAPGFFDVVTYDPADLSDTDGNPNALTIPHSLGVKPGLMIIKNLDYASDWMVYHNEIGYGKYLTLNENLQVHSSDRFGQEPDSSNFYVRKGLMETSNDGNTYVAYLFADNPEGGISCGKYTGSVASKTIELPFWAGWVMVKNSINTRDWVIGDSNRGALHNLFPNKSAAEEDDVTSGGLYVGQSQMGGDTPGFGITPGSMGNGAVNDGNPSTEYIYVAIADSTVRFYDEKTASTVTNHTLTKRYGVDPETTDLSKFGIFPLSEQPTYSVAAYVKEGNEYTPIRTYESELNRANARIQELQTNFEARIAALEGN